MDERKILLLVLTVIVYFLYNVYTWFMGGSLEEEKVESVLPAESDVIPEAEVPLIKVNGNENTKVIVNTKVIPLYFIHACSILDIFTQKPAIVKKNPPIVMNSDRNTIAVFGITIFLIGLVVHALLDILKVKEEEKARRKLNPNEERRQSLAEFANKKPLRRESSKFGLQLFQIAESSSDDNEEKKNRRQMKLYARGDSINSYLSEKKPQSIGSAPASVGETAGPTPEHKLVKRQSVAKLFGCRPVPMVRRSSFPALPLNPDIQAVMLGAKQPSFDSDDEDGKGKRVRIIRRF